MPVNLSQLCAFGNRIIRTADFGRTAESDLDGWRITLPCGGVCHLNSHQFASFETSSLTHAGGTNSDWPEVIFCVRGNCQALRGSRAYYAYGARRMRSRSSFAGRRRGRWRSTRGQKRRGARRSGWRRRIQNIDEKLKVAYAGSIESHAWATAYGITLPAVL